MLISETIKGLRNNFPKLREAIESKVNLGKIKVMFGRGITQDAFLNVKSTHVGSAA